MSAMAFQITGVSIVCSPLVQAQIKRKHQSSASLAFMRGIHWWPVYSPHKVPVTGKCFHLMTSWCVIMFVQTIHSNIIERKMLSFWWHSHHWLHRKLSFWQLSVQPVMKISSKWQHFRFSDVRWIYTMKTALRISSYTFVSIIHTLEDTADVKTIKRNKGMEKYESYNEEH